MKPRMLAALLAVATTGCAVTPPPTDFALDEVICNIRNSLVEVAASPPATNLGLTEATVTLAIGATRGTTSEAQGDIGLPPVRVTLGATSSSSRTNTIELKFTSPSGSKPDILLGSSRGLSQEEREALGEYLKDLPSRTPPAGTSGPAPQKQECKRPR